MTKVSLKRSTGIDTSMLASKTDLASLETKFDNSDINKFKTVSAALSKRRNVVDNDFVKKLCMVNWFTKPMLLSLKHSKIKVLKSRLRMLPNQRDSSHYCASQKDWLQYKNYRYWKEDTYCEWFSDYYFSQYKSPKYWKENNWYYYICYQSYSKDKSPRDWKTVILVCWSRRLIIALKLLKLKINHQMLVILAINFKRY